MSLFGKDILALDWDHRQLRAVSARGGKGRAVVRSMFQEPLPAEITGEDPAAFGAWLKRVLSKHHCARGQTLLAIPRDQVVLKTLLLPSNTPDVELPAIVQFQMQKELPFPIDSAVIDYALAGEPAGEAPPAPAKPAAGAASPAGAGQSQQAKGEPSPPATREYLVAATRKEVIEYYRKLAEAAGLDLRRIGLRCFSNVQVVRACAPMDVTRRLLLVNVGPELTEIDVIRGGGLLFSRSASVTFNEREDPTEFLNRLTLEVIRTVQAARAMVADLEIDGCVVAAPEWLSSSIAERLSQRLDVRGSVLEPGATAELKLPAEHRRGAGQFCAALGLVLGQTAPTSPPFDFLHPHKPVDLVAMKKQHRRTALLAAAAAVVFVLAGNYLAMTLTDNTQKLAAEAASLEKEAKRAEAMADEIDRLNKFKRSPDWLENFIKINKDWMADLHENAVVNACSGEITDDGWRIRLKGQARSLPVVTDIRRLLEKLYPPPQFSVPREKPPGQLPSQTFSSSFEESVKFTATGAGEKRKP